MTKQEAEPVLYKYIWQECCELTTNKPVLENIYLTDLVTGKRYLTHSVTDSTIHTFPAGCVTGEELNQLRERYQFTPDQFSRPFDHVVF